MNNFENPMKWWGWGREAQTPCFDHKPYLWNYICEQFALDAKPSQSLPLPAIDDVRLPAKKDNPDFINQIGALRERLLTDRHARITHSVGRSFRDLWQVRGGAIPHAVDAVFYPKDVDEIELLLAAAGRCNVVLIPFGGGSNIVGSLTPRDRSDRMIVSVDMTYLNRLLSIDTVSNTEHRTIQAGALGDVLEQQLNEHGYTIGHFPDSFLHSSLGGWIATRSAGMQSDEYGCIENIVISVSVLTPRGKLQTSLSPRSSVGINLKEMMLGSEGCFGFITDATVRIRAMRKIKRFYGYVFPDFPSGLEAIRENLQRHQPPLISRLSDINRTALSFAFRDASSSRWQSRAAKTMRWFIESFKGIDFSRCCMFITALEGEGRDFRQKFSQSHRVLTRHGGACLGQSPGRAFAKSKFDFPHIRDYLWNYGIYADVSETSTSWRNIPTLYQAVHDAANRQLQTEAVPGWVGCHLSHNYPDGASLYFSFAFFGKQDDRDFDRYLRIKKSIQDAFIANGGTSSHHHSVGIEHAPWLNEEISPLGLEAFGQLKDAFDPDRIMNPHKIEASTFSEWGLPSQ